MEGELKDAITSGREWRDALNSKVASGLKFLKSEASKIYIGCIRVDF